MSRESVCPGGCVPPKTCDLGYHEIWSASGQYASYWNTVLFTLFLDNLRIQISALPKIFRSVRITHAGSYTVLRFCPNIARTLPKHCPNFAQTLPELYPNIARTLPKHYPNFAHTLPKHCPNITRTLPEHCPNFAQTLPKLCPNFA